MQIRYVPKFGTLEIKVGSHRHILHRAGVHEDDSNYSGSDVSGETQLVKDVFAAVSALPLRDGDPVAFDTKQCRVQIKTRGEVRHDADMSKEGAEVQAFHTAVHAYDAGRFTEMQQLEELRDAPAVYQTKIIEVENIQIIDGVPTAVMVNKEVIDSDLKALVRNGVETDEFIRVPIIKTAAIPVATKDKDRLEVLKATDVK